MSSNCKRHKRKPNISIYTIEQGKRARTVSVAIRIAPRNLSTSSSLNSSLQKTSLLPSSPFSRGGDLGCSHEAPTEENETEISASEVRRERKGEEE